MDFTSIPVEYIGFGATAVLLMAMLSYHSALRRKILHSLASALILCLGLILGSAALTILGGLLTTFTLTLLIVKLVRKERFTILKVRPGNEYLREFLRYHEAEIKKIFPKFSFEDNTHRSCYLLLRNLEVSGVLILRHYDDDTLMVDIDFVIPKYRDSKAGRYLFQENFGYILPPGYEKLITFTRDSKHKKYLRAMGFEKSEGYGNKTYYEKHRNPATRKSTMMAASFSF